VALESLIHHKLGKPELLITLHYRVSNAQALDFVIQKVQFHTQQLQTCILIVLKDRRIFADGHLASHRRHAQKFLKCKRPKKNKLELRVLRIAHGKLLGKLMRKLMGS